MRRSLFVLISGFLLLSGCNRSDSPSGKGPDSSRKAGDLIEVVATTSMIADLARIVGQPHVSVNGLMGPGVDPHLYKASEGDVSLMIESDLVIYSGIHLEGKMVDIFEQMAGRGDAVFALADAFSTEDLLESSYFAGNYDPHFWFDVGLWKKAALHLAGVFSQYDPDHADQYLSNAEAYAGQLDELHVWISAEIQRIPAEMRVLVTSHDAFGYFGRAYGMEVKGLQGLSTATEAGTGDVQELAEFVTLRKIPAIFLESSISPRGIEAVLEAVKSRGFEVKLGGTLYGDALGSPGSQSDTYVGMVRSNTDLLVKGLSGP